MGTRALVAVAVVLIAGLLAGCDDEDPPDTKESTSAPAPPTTSATTATTPTGPVEPTFPPEAIPETKAGAESFAEYYWEVVNYSQISGETTLLDRLSIDSCAGCNGGIEAIERVYARGGRITGGRSRVIKAVLMPKPSGGWSVDQTIHVARQRIRGAGDLDQTSAPGTISVLLGVTFQGGSWIVTSLDV